MNNKKILKKNVLKVPSEPEYIRKVSYRIISSLSGMTHDEPKLFDIKLSVEEAVRNAIAHGNKSDKARSVTVSYWLDGRDLNIEVADEGEGFDHTKVPNPTEKENIMKNSGRGVYLIKRLMDKVEFNRSGNVIKMTKNL
jgi:serine/threonine-protein kinase RsbW